MKSVIVTGGTGLLGRQAVRHFESTQKWTVKGTGFSRADGVSILKVDLGNTVEVESTIDSVKYLRKFQVS
jgi:uncharacterized protein YbjT (DUF2867 family)